jgi:protoporphyrinogen oxidase
MSQHSQPTSQKGRIAVLGAGPMGLAVAYQLARDGYEPVIFEADDRIGGMTAAFDFSGTSIERYYHFHCTSDQAFFDILKELGLSNQLHWTHAKMGFWFNNQLQDWGNPIALLRFKGLGFIAKIRYGVHAFLSVRRDDWHSLDHKDAVTWVKKWVGPEAYDALWRLLFEYKFYEYTNNLSAAWIWSRIRRLGRSRYDLFREKLGYLDGGSDTLLRAMQSDIEKHGGVIRLSTPVQKVCIENGSIQGVELKDGFESFDKVISTIPLPYVPKLIPDLPQTILQQFIAKKNIAVACVIVKMRKALTDYFWLNTNDPQMDIPGLVEYSNLRNMGQEHIAYVPFYLPGEHPIFAESVEVF